MLGDLAEGGLLGGAEDGDPGRAADRVAERRRRAAQALLDAAGGEAGIVIGTHALLEDKVQFSDLGLVVVDEQHRFGVEQRAALSGKAGTPPHVLVMTATPIPRTVAMTVFGDLDTSTLAELPAGRGDVQTNVVPPRRSRPGSTAPGQRIREEVGTGRQAYVVCSRIDPTRRRRGGPEASAARGRGARPELAGGPLAGLRVEMLHGRMAPDDKDRVMQAFAARRGRRARLHDGDRGRRRRPQRDGDGDPRRRPLRRLPAAPAPRPDRPRRPRRAVPAGHRRRARTRRAWSGSTAVAATRDGFELSRIDLEQRREGNVLGTEQSGGRVGASGCSRCCATRTSSCAAREAATDAPRRRPDLADARPAWRAAVRRLEDSEQADFLDMAMTMTRIIGGTRRRAGGCGRPTGDATRPTSDRVREALFSALESAARAR